MSSLISFPLTLEQFYSPSVDTARVDLKLSHSAQLTLLLVKFNIGDLIKALFVFPLVTSGWEKCWFDEVSIYLHKNVIII